MRFVPNRLRVRAVAALLLLDVVAGATVASVGVARGAVDDDVPSALHGAVETQGLTAGNGALALFVDPGTAYAYSTLDRDDYGGGSVSHTMTARGANLNLGTIAYAVLWAAPDCSQDGNYGCIASGQMGTPNTGLHEAAGFPLYAEALYPPPPAEDGESREYVYKCVVNKDAPGAQPTGGAPGEVCKSSDGVPLSSWAEAPGKDLRATGFSRGAGFNVPDVVSIGGSESHSDVRYAGGGELVSRGRSAVTDISILGGQITIESSRAEASITSSASGEPKRSADCTFSGMRIGGTPVRVDDLSNPEVQAALDAIAEATNYEVEIKPPPPVVSEEREGGKQVASCTGVRIFLTDLNQGSPVPACAPPVDPSVPECVPAAGNRIELTFGTITVQQSVNDLAGGTGGGLGGLLDGIGGAIDSVTGVAQSPSPGALTTGSGDTAFAPPASGADAAESSVGAPVAPDVGIEGSQLASAVSGRNLGAIGALTALSATALMGALLLLVGVVRALGTGGRFRLPGL